MAKAGLDKTTIGLALLILVQAACGLFFLSDAISDIIADGPKALTDFHLHVETVATLSMAVAIVVEARLLARLLRRQAHFERGMSIASGALHDLIESYFAEWKLTPSETDVATFTIKGMDIAEIAVLRGCAEGTVKAHLNAIYRKSGTTGRGALVGLLIEDLMAAPLVAREELPIS